MSMTAKVIWVIMAWRICAMITQASLDDYVRRSVSPTQYFALRFSGSFGFHVLSNCFEIVFSVSLVTLNAALQVWRIGDRDQKIIVPYKASGPLPPATSETTKQTQ